MSVMPHSTVYRVCRIARAVPVIKAIKERFDIPVSIDTYKYDVALSAFDAGADMLNDIWGLKKDERLAEIVAAKDRQVCITHNREKVGEDTGNELIDNVASELSECVGKALKAGVLKENILLDPGIGFGKNYMQNLYLIGHIDELIQKTEDNIRKTYPDKTESGGYYPFMMAASRKGGMGLTLDLDVEDRDDATIAISVYSVMKGCRGVRVHDVFGNSSALGMLEALNTH